MRKAVVASLENCWQMNTHRVCFSGIYFNVHPDFLNPKKISIIKCGIVYDNFCFTFGLRCFYLLLRCRLFVYCRTTYLCNQASRFWNTFFVNCVQHICLPPCVLQRDRHHHIKGRRNIWSKILMMETKIYFFVWRFDCLEAKQKPV